MADAAASISAASSATASAAVQLSAHDLLALGSLQNALLSKAIHPGSGSSDAGTGGNLQRLPLLLRLLAASRPLASLPTLAGVPVAAGSDSNDVAVAAAVAATVAVTDGDGDARQAEVDRIVSLLEQVAASHPSAELIEPIISVHVPEATASVGRVESVSRISDSQQLRNSGRGEESGRVTSDQWDTKTLCLALADKLPSGTGKKKRKRTADLNVEDKAGTDVAVKGENCTDNDTMDTSDDDDDASPLESESKRPKLSEYGGPPAGNGSGNASQSFLAAAHAAAGDTTESTVKRTLNELGQLIVASLRPVGVDLSSMSNDIQEETADGLEDAIVDGAPSESREHADNVADAAGDDGDDEEGGGVGSSNTSRRSKSAAAVLLPLPSDSLLAEAAYHSPSNEDGEVITEDDDNDTASSAGKQQLHGYGAGTELAATTASLMHRTPALRHRHLASALCRAMVPQTASILLSLASNCPCATQSLLAGCIDAAIVATAASSGKSTSSSASASLTKVLEIAKASVRSIASLSKSEAWTVANTLMQFSIMQGVALDLLIEVDPSAATTLMREGLNAHVEALRCRSMSNDRKPSQPKRSKGRRRVVRPSRDIRSEHSMAARNKSWIVQVLRDDDELARKARKCILDSIQSLYNGEDVPSLGKAVLCVRVLSSLICFIGIGSGSSFGSGSAFVQSSMDAIDILNGKWSGTDSSDELRALSICSVLLTCARFSPIADAKQTFLNNPASSACAACLNGLLEPTNSAAGNEFVYRVASCLASEDSSELCNLVISRLFGEGIPNVGFLDNFEHSLFNTCRWATLKVDRSIIDSLNETTEPSSVVLLNDSFCRGTLSYSESEHMMAAIINNAERCRNAVQQQGLPVLMENAVKEALSDNGTKIPIVLPLRLEALSQKVPWARSDFGDPASEAMRCQTVVQAMYALLFLQQAPSSPFVIDPRCLPLPEICSFCKTSNLICDEVTSRVQELVSKVAPGSLSSLDRPTEPEYINILEPSLRRHATIDIVTEAITTAKESASSVGKETACRRAELLFLKARAELPASEVDAEITCALLSTQHLPRRSYSYSSLCKDPMLILKCPLSVWKNNPLRRIMLSILRRLMVANEHVALATDELCDVERQHLELLRARDALIARTLLIAGSSSFNFDAEGSIEQNAVPTNCHATISFVRSIIANRQGIVATLIKQDLPTSAIDWMIEISPECFCDADLLANCLSGQSSLTAAERMVTADAALRIAIAHGSRDEKVAQRLACSALNVLVSSFFLSLGPIGVPVNIIHEGDGGDITQTCRRATFRCLAAIHSVQPDRIALKNEARRALNKMGNMCKGEGAIGGVTGPVAMRRKTVLKEIWEAVIRSSNCIGGL